MKTLEQKLLTGERVLYGARDLLVKACVFDEGESPLKEAKGIVCEDCLFRYKYPMWYCTELEVRNSTWFELGRSGVWYTEHMKVLDCVLQAPKNFRYCKHLLLENTYLANAQETLWNCSDVTLRRVHAKGDYLGFHNNDCVIEELWLDGNYAFDSSKNLTITNSRLISKDALWNCENVVVKDSVIQGEYLGWNSRNLTFINCTIESNQGLCYIDGLKMENCRLINTDLCFELCKDIDATLTSPVLSIKNPINGVIRVPALGELIMDPTRINPTATQLVCDSIEKRSDTSDRWEESL